MPKSNIHVVPHDGDWAWRRAGSDRVSEVSRTQGQAERHAREAARRDGVELFIHGRDGAIRERNTYGNDPCPPRG
jgi:hypothetical protein